MSKIPDFAGVGRSTFYRVMNGSASPTLNWIERMAAAFEVDASELIRPSKR